MRCTDSTAPSSKPQAPSVRRVLVTGATGLLGGRIASRLAEHFEVVAGQRVLLDVAVPDSVERAFEAARPDAVVHAAAMADPDRCEREPEAAQRVNVRGCEEVARACDRWGLHLVSLSTDLVFPGDHAFQGETDPPRPISTYGRTKLQGEEAVLGLSHGAAVARVTLVTGRGHGPRGSATEAIAWALRAGRRLRLFHDQFRTPIDADSVADAVLALLERHGAGRYHLGGPERLSRHAIGLRVAAVLGLPATGIEAIAYRDQPAQAARPADVSLESSRARQELRWAPRTLDAAIRLGRAVPDIIPTPSGA
jgi:dTDP-4-dehydrorhamnose reductase